MSRIHNEHSDGVVRAIMRFEKKSVSGLTPIMTPIITACLSPNTISGLLKDFEQKYKILSDEYLDIDSLRELAVNQTL